MARALKLNEFGLVFRHDAKYDLTAQTSLTLTLTKPDRTTLAKTLATGLSIGTVDYDASADGLGTMLANEYVQFTTGAGEMDQAGRWTSELAYADATQSLRSEVATFEVIG